MLYGGFCVRSCPFGTFLDLDKSCHACPHQFAACIGPGESDGLECSSDDEANGYFAPECLKYVDALIQQATDAGLWVILAARAKYAAGWGLGQPDVWGDHTLRRKMRKAQP